MSATHGMNNQGIMHAVFAYGEKPLCGSRRALMATVIEKFRDDQKPCKRCASKLAEMDARAAKKAEAKTKVFIDATPTWVGILPLYLAALVDGTPTAQSAVREELRRMAELADAYVAKAKTS